MRLWAWMMKNARGYSWTIVFALALFAPAAWAQQPDPRVDPPIPPDQLAAPDESSSSPNVNAPATALGNEMIPDTSPLSGAEQFTLGRMGKARNYFLPSIQSFETIDTNAHISGQNSDIVSATSLMGQIALLHNWSRFQLSADYRGGEILYRPQSELSTSIHDFRFAQRIAWRRWYLLLTDEVGYSPESSFGFHGFSSGQSTFDAGFNPAFQTNQSILTVRSSRLVNTAIGQVQYTLSRKSSLMVSASYGILRFQQVGFVNNSHVAARTGYSYNLTRKDSIGLFYGFTAFRFEGRAQRIYDHSVHLSYGRRVTGRLALQLSAGPDLYQFRNQVAGSARQISWTVDSALIYRFRNTNFQTDYSSRLTGGAGVLSGSRTDQVRLTTGQRLSRNLYGSVDLGYARNAVLPQTASATGSVFSTWYAGLQMTRLVGRHTSVYLNYNFQRQSSDIALCALTICGGPVTLRHHFGIGFEWHRRTMPNTFMYHSVSPSAR